MSPLAYLRIWLASLRYSIVRTLMFRFDFFLWITVDVAWMTVNLLLIEVTFRHVDTLAGWTKPQMILLLGTALVVMRLFMAFFMTNLFAVDRNVREGTLDFYLAQPGNPLFMIATRKVELDGVFNTVLALGIVGYAVRQLNIDVTLGGVAFYAFLILLGLVIHFSTVVLIVSLAFWIVRIQGIEQGYWGLFEISRLPRRALHGVMYGAMELIFVYAFPAVLITNFPAESLLHGPKPVFALWLGAAALAWFAIAVTVFHRGLRRYSSASS